MKAPSPLLGFNNNFKHKGQVYHIQTEDSGVKHPHIITHLFADGGRILKSIKTSYAQYLEEANMPEIVRQMMKDQHKAMIVALRDGRFDPGGTREVDLPTGGYFANATSPGLVRKTEKAEPPKDPVERAEKKASEAPKARKSDRAARLEVDVAALEKAAAGAAAAAPEVLPPPPPNVIAGGGARPHGEYANVQPGTRKSMRPPSARPPTPRAPSLRPSAAPAAGSPSRPPSGRYAMTRPASIFATSKPSPSNGSLFGEDLISERSLDEVILAYLAEDLDGEKK
jgi:hypothetical protein